jgi:peptide/nickel transport system substrate-binding protein
MKWTKLIAAAATSVLVVLAAGMHAAYAEGVLRIGTNQDSTTFDPIKTIENRDIWVMNNMHAFLVRANREANQIVPDLAESWEISDDGLEYTFHLREAKFSDGSRVTVQDAVFSLTRLRDDPESVQSAMYQIIAEYQRT